jgi:hypothetical protein
MLLIYSTEVPLSFNIIPKHPDTLFHLCPRSKRNRAVTYTAVLEQPFPLPHYYAISNILNIALAAHWFLHSWYIHIHDVVNYKHHNHCGCPFNDFLTYSTLVSHPNTKSHHDHLCSTRLAMSATALTLVPPITYDTNHKRYHPPRKC